MTTSYLTKPTNLTRHQVAALRRIVAHATRPFLSHSYSVARLTISQFCNGQLSVVISAKRDGVEEGSVMEMLTERYGHFFVGIRGGIEAKTHTPYSAARMKRSPLIFGFTNS